MQTHRQALVPLLSGITRFLLVLLAFPLAAAAAPRVPKTHTVTLGPPRRVPYTPPEATPDTPSDDATNLRIRSLDVDGSQKEWTLGEVHDVTDRTFVVRRALRINDSLPSEPPRWTWQPGSWLMVDRATGHITALHLPAYDSQISNVAWFRDYAAYCGVLSTAKGGLVAVIAQLGARKPVILKVLSPWPPPAPRHPACAVPTWQRSPMRATLQPTGGQPLTFDVVGTISLIEDNDPADP